MLFLDILFDAEGGNFAMTSRAIALIVLLSLILSSTRGLSSLSPRDHRHGSKKTHNNQEFKRDLTTRSNEKTVVIVYNKPAEVITSHISGDSRSTVYDEVQSMKGFLVRDDHELSSSHQKEMDSSSLSFERATGIRSKLHAIGRLDADTKGLLLLTNDGGLVHHVTNRNAPTHHQHTSSVGPITKTYEALIMGHHDDESLASLWSGVDIGAKYGGITRPVEDLQILDHPNHKSTLVSLTISEGKNRQVRRMFHALGSGVMKLKRTKIGEHLTLDGVEESMWRILSEEEVRNYLGWEIQDLSQARAEDSTNQKVFPRRPTGSTTKKKRQTGRGSKR